MPQPVLKCSVRAPTPGTLKRYGLTPAEWRAMLRRQGGVCAVCRKVPRCGFLNVDHHHVRGWKRMPPEERKLHVRGLVCPWCNHHLLGKHLTLEKARAALAYLEAHHAKFNGA